MIIAIDGPAGSGKSSTARIVAEKLGILHLDTGAMYRAITLKCLRQNITCKNIQALANCVNNTVIEFSDVPPNMKVLLDGKDVSVKIRSEEITQNVSDYCKPAVVREALVKQQRLMAQNRDVICEGRDIGTVVFPRAELKFFMVASIEERALRRKKDLEKIGIHKTLKELIKEIELRDHKDSKRKNSPLMKAHDAEEIDTTSMTLDMQVEYIVSKIHKLMKTDVIN
jgi:cytidylate kinase